MATVEEKSSSSCLSGRCFLAFLGVCIFLAAALGYLYYISEIQENETQNDSDKITESIQWPGNEIAQPPINLTTIDWEKNEELNIFREYLRIKTDHPDIDYRPCVEFLKLQAEKANLSVSIYYPANDENPVVVMTWPGLNPDLPAIVLNSHMDVVPAFDEYWTHPPFAAEIDKHGNIYGRGAQDTKAIGMQYLAAIRSLKAKGIKQFKRTIYVLFVPDEEMGSSFGMRPFIHTDTFRSMNIGLFLDEGIASESGETLYLSSAERSTWRIEFICYGQTGHGSIMFANTAAVKLFYLIKKFNELRDIEAKKDNETSIVVQRNVTSINLTVIKGGLEANVVPPEMRAIFDIRLAVDADHDAFEKQINQWCEEAGGNITIKFHIKDSKAKVSVTDDTNPYWKAFKNASEELNLQIEPVVIGASSDSSLIRNIGITAFGFAPLLNTTPNLHSNDEYLNAKVYLNGIGIYEKIILHIADL